MRHRLDARDDSGASLILVLILVTVLALGVTVLLSFTDTSVRTTVAMRHQTAAVYNADGAMQAAINNIRNSDYHAGTGQTCFGGSNTLPLNNFYGADSAAVTCSPDPSRVLIRCPSLSQCNRPGNAILTLGKTSEQGLHVTPLGSGGTFRVHGRIFSNSSVNVTNGTLETNAAAYARTWCTGTIVSTPAPASCNYGNVANPIGDDPNYATASATVPPHRSLPSCAKQVVEFEPGYYDDANALSNMMKGNNGNPCKGHTWWFKPGTYYFDFHNKDNENPLLDSNGGDVWTINDGALVAGTPASGSNLNAPTIPGSCVNPIDTPTAVGVQFIFGGQSQMALGQGTGRVEICGTYDYDVPPVAVYGLKSGTETTTSNTLRMNGFLPGGKFANPGRITDPDNQLATWAKNNSSPETGTVTVNGYAPPAAIPAGSVLQDAKLRVVHGNSAGSSNDKLSVDISPNGGTPFTVTVPSYTDHAMHTELIDVSAGRTGTLAQLVYAGNFTGASMTYSATVKHQGEERIDAIQLELSYRAPAFRALNGCLTGKPYTGSPLDNTACALLSTPSNNGGTFYVQGTTYTPTAAVDITLNNAAEQVFRFGVISRTLWLKETASFSYTGPVIEVPDDSPGYVFSVYLNVYICPGAANCSPIGNPVLRSKVAYVDDDPVTPVPGRRQVVVLSWST